LPYTYPKAAEEAAERISAEITQQDYDEREDFRNVFTCTIDPRDAKDFDDALSIRMLDKGLWQVGVHIADVSHYVTEGSIIDKEAMKRATSVYLVDRTIPMLPERLCNFICSLRPDEEKLAYSVIFNMDENADINGIYAECNGDVCYNACKRVKITDKSIIFEVQDSVISVDIEGVQLNERFMKYSKEIFGKLLKCNISE